MDLLRRALLAQEEAQRGDPDLVEDPLPTPPKRNGLCDLLWSTHMCRVFLIPYCDETACAT